MENPCRRAARRNPYMIAAGDGNACPAGGERGLARKRSRHVFTWNDFPRRSAVGGAKDHEAAVDRVTERDAVRGIPERESIEETLWVTIRELQRPRAAGVGRFVNSRFLTFTDAEKVSGVGVNGLDVAEIHVSGAGNSVRLPM